MTKRSPLCYTYRIFCRYIIVNLLLCSTCLYSSIYSPISSRQIRHCLNVYSHYLQRQRTRVSGSCQIRFTHIFFCFSIFLFFYLTSCFYQGVLYLKNKAIPFKTEHKLYETEHSSSSLVAKKTYLIEKQQY